MIQAKIALLPKRGHAGTTGTLSVQTCMPSRMVAGLYQAVERVRKGQLD